MRGILLSFVVFLERKEGERGEDREGKGNLPGWQP